MDNRSIIKKFLDWLTDGGAMKMIGRIVMLVGIIAALVIVGIGVKEMYAAAIVERDEDYVKAYEKQQKSELKAMEKENRAAEKAGEELPHVLPESYKDIVLAEPPVVKLDLEEHLGDFVTGYLGWAIIPLAAGIFLGWVIGNLVPWFKAMQAAGPVRVTAGAFFWGGVVIAAGFLLAGLWHILNINSSTLPEVGAILTENYLIWSVAALGCGFGVQRAILKTGKEREAIFAVEKGNTIGKYAFLVLFIAAPFVVTACVMAAIRFGWVVGLIALLVYGIVLAGAWMLSGTCPLIRTQEEIEAERARRARTSWICDECGTENPRSVATCSKCSAIKPEHHM